MAHRNNSCVSSQMKLKRGSNIICVTSTSIRKKADDVIVILFL